MMDLSIYYEEFEHANIIAGIVVILAFFVTVFLCICTIREKSSYTDRVWKKVLFCVGYCLIFGSVVANYFIGPYPAQKDIEQQTIYGYEGNFEIVQTTHGIYHKAVFLIDGEEICLKYFEDDDYQFESVTPGVYDGKLIYAQHAAQLLYMEIEEARE